MKTGVQSIGDVLGELAARRGLLGVRRACLCETAWREAAGEQAARFSRPGPIRRGRLEVMVANSTWLQELAFRKQQLLTALAKLLPDESIQDLRFRVGPVDRE